MISSPSLPTCASLGCGGPPKCSIAPSCPLRMSVIEGAFVTAVGLGFCVTICVIVIAGHGSTEAIGAAGGIAAFGGTIYAHLRNGFAQSRISQKVDRVEAKADQAAAKAEVAADSAGLAAVRAGVAADKAELSVTRTDQTASALAETQSTVIDKIEEVRMQANGNLDKIRQHAEEAGFAKGKAAALEKVVEVLPVIVPSTSANFEVPKTG